MGSPLSRMLKEYTGTILGNNHLTDGQLQEKIVQVFDLCHFIDCYGQPLQIVDFSQCKINIVEEEGVQKGIYFCDLLYSTNYAFDWLLFLPAQVESMRQKLALKELWFVIVEENLSKENLISSKLFIDIYKVKEFYDKIFYFNFSQSTVRILK